MHTSYLSLAVLAIGATAAPSFPKPNGDPFAGSFPFFPSGSSSESDEDSGLSNPVPAYMAAMQAVQSAQQGAYGTPQPTHAVVSKPHHQHAVPAPAPAPAPIHEEPELFHPKAEHEHQHKPMQKPHPAAPAPMDDPVESDPVPSDAIPAIPPQPAAPAPETSSHKAHPAVPSSAIAEEIAEAIPDDGINNVAEETPKSTNAPVTITPINSAMQTPMPEHKKPMAAPSSSEPMIHATPTHAMMSSFVSIASPRPTHRPMHSMGIHEGHMASSKASATPSSSGTPTPTPSHGPATKSDLLGLGSLAESLPVVGPLLASLGV